MLNEEQVTTKTTKDGFEQRQIIVFNKPFIDVVISYHSLISDYLLLVIRHNGLEGPTMGVRLRQTCTAPILIVARSLSERSCLQTAWYMMVEINLGKNESTSLKIVECRT